MPLPKDERSEFTQRTELLFLPHTHTHTNQVHTSTRIGSADARALNAGFQAASRFNKFKFY